MSSIAFIVKIQLSTFVLLEEKKKAFYMFAIHWKRLWEIREKRKKSQMLIGGLVRLALNDDDDRQQRRKNIKYCRQKRGEEKSAGWARTARQHTNEIRVHVRNSLIWLPMIHKHFFRVRLEFFFNLFSYTHLTWLLWRKIY